LINVSYQTEFKTINYWYEKLTFVCHCDVVSIFVDVHGLIVVFADDSPRRVNGRSRANQVDDPVI